ncbi:MAG: beta-phosphoglucomutase [Clostridiales bacterium]|jgi:beta-phosphoglucomutase|nr:beta-phosphoglucomutase [Clostridiales bacterium]
MFDLSPYDAIVFDLDGVIVSTDEQHYLAWKMIADDEGIPYSREINNRQRGVSRMESLDVLLEAAPKAYSQAEKDEMAFRKNEEYKRGISFLKPSDMLEGMPEILALLKEKGLKSAIASSSKNTNTILERLELSNWFDAVVSGSDIKASKPDPEVFSLAAQWLGLDPAKCLCVEDAKAGIESGRGAGMKTLGIGPSTRGISDFHFEETRDFALALGISLS